MMEYPEIQTEENIMIGKADNRLVFRYGACDQERSLTMGKRVEWISVAERKPTPCVSVLLYLPEDSPLLPVHEGYYLEGYGFRTVLYGKAFPSHWAAMPDPPDGREERPL